MDSVDGVDQDGIEMVPSHPEAPPHQPPSPSLQPNNQSGPPRADVVITMPEEDIKTTNENCRKFIRAVFVGDKDEAVRIFDLGHEEVVQTIIGWNGETAFHMAVKAAKERHVSAVVKEILSSNHIASDINILANATPYGSNALHYAAISGNLEIVKAIHELNGNLANTINNQNAKPIYLAALKGHTDVIQFLLEHTTFDVHDRHGSSVLNLCISGGLFGLAAELVQIHNLYADENGETALEVLARVPSTVSTSLFLNFPIFFTNQL